MAQNLTTATALSLVQAVARRTSQNPNINGFSDNDDSNIVLTYLNDALEDLQGLQTTYIDAEASIPAVAGQRLYTCPVAGLDLYDIYSWSWRFIATDGSVHPISTITIETVISNFTNFETGTTAFPTFVYFDQGSIGLLPIPNGATGTLKFRYPTTATQFINPTDTINYPQKWLNYITLAAQFDYEVYKGIGNPVKTQDDMENAWGAIAVRASRGKISGFVPYRQITSQQRRYYPFGTSSQ